MNTQLARGMREAWIGALQPFMQGRKLFRRLTTCCQDVDGAGLAFSRCQ